MMKKTFFNLTLICSLALFSVSSVWSKSDFSGNTEEKRISVVVIDPGHGGKDFGASVGTAKEKDIVLDLALRLGNSIKAKYPEIKVIYTRSKDVFIPLYDRANIANKNKADLFISIHVNGTDKTSVQGTETFVLGQHRSKDNLEVAKKENSVILLEDDYNTKYEGFDPNSPESYIMFELVQDEYLEQSVLFASAIQNQFRQYAKRIDRSVKQAGFLVLRQTTMPSVLIEVGFISHANERSYLLSEKGKAALSTSIFNAFSDYKKKIENKSSFTVHTETGNAKSSSSAKNTELKSSTEMNTKTVETKTGDSVKNNNIFFSVQIAASAKKMEATPSNFKGEKNIFRVDAKDISRYYSGKFNTLQEAEKEKKRIQGKFPQSFVVAFENNELISVKKALEKM
jgi:N-acetylmuramoyl-L-alanine amidase